MSKSKGKGLAKSSKSESAKLPDIPKLIPEHLVVPYEGLGQSSSSNRFLVLGNPSQPISQPRVRPSSTRPPSSALSLASQYSKPTYSALASLPPSQSPDPYAIIETLSPAQSPIRLPAQTKEELQDLCRQMQLEVSRISGQGSNEPSPASSHSSSTSQVPPGDPLLQDSQDPYSVNLADNF
ncbi:hypothetical protein CJ030_MR5G017207 [Morella rubra]|uniref:Uncharacterized protein n=1 Tax=Morella rubra TaxID=262757 RepID=A0A6A1VMB6_9ROSI|nr:hypothetical protein CJ030_MR5G017207 [Morella rubra]